jgi:hypothetical protein
MDIFKDLTLLKIMASQFILPNYINEFDSNHIDDMRKKLLKLGVYSKDYEQDDLILLYNKFNTENKAPIVLECRSVVINRNNFNIENYSCVTPIYNTTAMNFLMLNQDKEKEIFMCYEGSLISLFNYNNNWFFSSRKNLLNIKNTLKNDITNPHFNMFKSVIEQDNFNVETFIDKLDKKYTYHFVLIHHLNKNIVNYENKFGKEYKKLCFIFARDKETKKEINSEDIDNLFLSDNIFLPKRLENIKKFDDINSSNLTSDPEYEGIIIKINNKVLKLQSIQYQFYKAIGHEKNLYRGFIHLYQNNKLKEYFENNEDTTKFKKILNPIKTDESFDTMGIIDAVFKVITKELFVLFNELWDFETGDHKNKEIYNLLPNEYKTMLFNIRKIYFIKKKQNNELLIKHIYYYLKSVDVIIIEKILRMRKLMLNLVRNNTDHVIQSFGKTTNVEKKVLNKLCAIYTSKLFPEIMPDDLPKLDNNNN